MASTALTFCSLILAIHCFQTAAHYTSDFVVPTNTAVLQGNSAELKCRPNSSSDVYSWIFQPAAVNEAMTIYSYGVGFNNNAKTSFYVRKHTDGSVDLVSDATQPSDAGLYSCIIRVYVTEEGASAIKPQTAQLIVLDGEPRCSTNIIKAASDDDILQMSCSISFRGNLVPVIEWRQNTEDGSIISDGVEMIAYANANVTSTLRLLRRPDVAFIICRTQFKSSVGENESFVNMIQDYNCTRCFPSLNVPQSASQFVFPQNTAVLRRNSAELKCRPNSTSDVCGWNFKPAGAAEDVIIYRSRVIYNPDNTITSFSVQKLYDGSVDLVTNSTQLSDAGLYTCIICVNVTAEGALALIQQSAQLIVFDGEPNCEIAHNVSVTTNLPIEIRCTVSYRGNWAPVIEWRENEDFGIVIHDGIDTVTVSNVSITFMLSLLARNGVRFSCRIHFAKNLQNDSDDVNTMATNIPSYNYTWASQRIAFESVVTEEVTHWPLNLLIIIVVVCGAGLIIAAFVATAVILSKKLSRETQMTGTCNSSPSKASVQPTELYETISKLACSPNYVSGQCAVVSEKAPDQEIPSVNEQSWVTTHQHLYSHLAVTDEAEHDVMNIAEEHAIAPNLSSPLYEEITADESSSYYADLMF